jgi:hypothetical protein
VDRKKNSLMLNLLVQEVDSSAALTVTAYNGNNCNNNNNNSNNNNNNNKLRDRKVVLMGTINLPSIHIALPFRSCEINFVCFSHFPCGSYL